MTCPICGRSADVRVRPFCSRRCADIDLGRWMRGAYALPSQAEEDAGPAVEEIEPAAAQGPRRRH